MRFNLIKLGILLRVMLDQEEAVYDEGSECRGEDDRERFRVLRKLCDELNDDPTDHVIGVLKCEYLEDCSCSQTSNDRHVNTG